MNYCKQFINISPQLVEYIKPNTTKSLMTELQVHWKPHNNRSIFTMYCQLYSVI